LVVVQLGTDPDSRGALEGEDVGGYDEQARRIRTATLFIFFLQDSDMR